MSSLDTKGFEIAVQSMCEQFAVDCRNGMSRLSPAMNTGFVWTRRENTLVLAANKKYFAAAIANPCITAIVSPPEAITAAGHDKTILVTNRADECFYFLHSRLINADSTGAMQKSTVHESAIIEPGVHVGDGVSIGKGVRVGANCVLYGPLTIGENVIIEPGVVIGCEGLFAKRIDHELQQIPHFGGVEIGEGAYIHANAVIVRSAMKGELTSIGARTHIGVMSNIGHDAQIAAEAVISSNTVIAGRAQIGERSWIGASATVSNAVKIGADARVNIGAVCIRDVAPGEEVSGNFALSHTRRLKQYVMDLRGQ